MAESWSICGVNEEEGLRGEAIKGKSKEGKIGSDGERSVDDRGEGTRHELSRGRGEEVKVRAAGARKVKTRVCEAETGVREAGIELREA